MKNNKKWSSNRLRNFQIGILVALSAVLMAFEWSSVPPEYINEVVPQEVIDVTVIERTVQEKKKVEVVPPTVIKDIIDVVEPQDEFTNEPDIEEKATSVAKVVEQASVVPVASKKVKAAPIVVPDDDEEEDDRIISIVENMPLFGTTCKDLPTNADRNECSKVALLSYVYKNVKYPALASENRIEGMVIVQFVIEKDGSVSNIKIVRDIGAGCGKEVVRLVKGMPDWVPGRQGIHKVRVKYTLPVKFKLKN